MLVTGKKNRFIYAGNNVMTSSAKENKDEVAITDEFVSNTRSVSKLAKQDQLNQYFRGKRSEPAANLAHDILQRVAADLVLGSSNVYRNCIRTANWAKTADLKDAHLSDARGTLGWSKNQPPDSETWFP